MAARSLSLLLGLLPLPGPLQEDGPASFFETRILPVLEERCFDCHTRDAGMAGDLLVDSLAGLLEGGERGPALVPGDPEASLLLRALRYEDPDVEMPPDEPLAPEVVDDFAEWIRTGAHWAAEPAAGDGPWWSFEPMANPEPPPVQRGDLCDGDVDRFLQARLEAVGLEPAPAADRRTLLRRVTLDLTGLPPTAAELDDFLADGREDAWERVVDRLLASPAYGEAAARRWLDLARYADTAGDASDYPIEDAWRYRNYVIESLRADKPYDRFLREQVAGDLLGGTPEERVERTTATGFLALARRYGVGRDQDRHLIVGDMIDTVGRAVLAETLACARCHDHKVDPIRTEEYYALYGIFASTRVPFPGSENEKAPERLVVLEFDQGSPAEARRRDELAYLVGGFDRELARAKAGAEEAGAWLDALSAAERGAAAQLLGRPAQASREPLDARVAALEARRAPIAKAHAELDGRTMRRERLFAAAEGKPKDSHVHRGGAPGRRGPVVPRGFPAALTPPAVARDVSAIERGSGRRELADWLVHPENPRTARVLVNRIWQQHFGSGLVATPSDFGRLGAAPSHPELLDWLARSFVADGWSQKALHRKILLSQAYRRSWETTAEMAELDPENRLLARFSPRRLRAEELRDAILLLADTLDRAPGGAHPFPPSSKWWWTQHRPVRADYPTHKRSVYLMVQRLRRHPFLGLFDGPDTNASWGARGETTVPAQALWLRNSEWVHERSREMARAWLGAAPDEAGRLDTAFLAAYGRPASNAEREELAAWLESERKAYDVEGSEDPTLDAWAGLARVLLASNEFLYLS
ncbi:MAG: PSD1 and planctomycete cytochrome C domain-containing protein [Planctomycetota bacterium]